MRLAGLVRACVLAACAGAHVTLGLTVFTVTATFEDDAFGLAELSARLEACASSDAGVVLRADCIKKLLSSNFACDGVGSEAVCVLDGVHINVADVSFACEAARGCPSTDETLSATLIAAIPVDGCDARPVSGFTDICYPSARCQWTRETQVTSFGQFCPSTLGLFCCASDATAANTVFPGGFLTPGNTVDYLKFSQVVDLSFHVTFDVAPPSLVRVIVDTPYVTSASTIVSIVNGVSRETRMCPSAYLFDFQDPVESLPPARAGDYRRASTQDAWTPLTFFPVDDLVGKPRSACGNFDMAYTSDGDFRSKFNFPDVVSDSFAYSAIPAVDTAVWNASVSPRDVPFGTDTWWKVGTPQNGRVNYTMGYWDLVAGFYGCKDYATGERLVDRRVESEFAYYMGVPYRIETYSWKIHLCQVGFFGSSCEDTTRKQTYAKTCAVIPVSFTVAPQQMSAVSTDSTSSSLTMKIFLQSVDSTTSNCTAGSERIAVVFHLVIFDGRLTIVEESMHDIRPTGLFEKTAQENTVIIDATAFVSANAFLASNPTAEGLYKLRTSSVETFDGNVVNQKLIVLTKCFFTGFDERRKLRARPRVFADSISTSEGVVQFEISIVFRRTGVDLDVRNTLNARILATKDTFLLREEIALKSQAAEAVHRLYGSYESAREDTGIVSNGLPEGAVLMGGDQLCSKHQAHGTHAAAISLRPNAVGACLLSPAGVARVDGEGVQLAGREIVYRATGMLATATYTFGCERNWIDVENVVRNAEGVYELGRLRRLPDENHQRAYWFVTQANLNEVEWGTSGRSLSDAFGVGLFHYDDGENKQIVRRSSEMQADPLTDVQRDEELDAGCVETHGNLRASCNLVCFTLTEGHLTGVVGENATLMVHHISVAMVAGETETEQVDRFQENKRRRALTEADSDADTRQEQTRLLTVRVEARETGAPDPGEAGEPREPGESGEPGLGVAPETGGAVTTSVVKMEITFVRDLFVGIAIGGSVVLGVCACAFCFSRCANIPWNRRKKR